MNYSADSCYQLAEQFGNYLLKNHLRCAVAESCTGGSLAAAITDIPGSSAWFDRGFVTYTNESKEELLHVPKHVLLTHGAVSKATVIAMAEGALQASHADVTLAISGIAGPTGGTPDKPVGTVWIAWASNWFETKAEQFFFQGDRKAIRSQSVHAALDELIKSCFKK